VPQAPLIITADLPRYGASSDFLSQFNLRPLVVQIVAGGDLGAMTWQWQRQGDSAWSELIYSEANAGQPWAYSPADPAFATFTFAPGTYVADATYTVSSTGVVTTSSFAGLTAARFDVREVACVEVTSLAVTWMQPRVVAPVISVGEQVKGWLADLVIYRLRSRQGMTPEGAGGGDDNVRLRAKDAERNLKAIGASQDRPPDLVDSSAGSGAGFPVYPIGDDLAGW
jgi:hypothetical protein